MVEENCCKAVCAWVFNTNFLKTCFNDFNVGDFFCSSCGADRPGVARPFSVLGEYLSEEVERGRDQQGVTNETPGTGIGGGPLQ